MCVCGRDAKKIDSFVRQVLVEKIFYDENAASKPVVCINWIYFPQHKRFEKSISVFIVLLSSHSCTPVQASRPPSAQGSESRQSLG